MTPEKLIEGLISKDKAAIEFLVINHQHSVIKTAYYFLNNMEDAEDLSQEVMLEILNSIGKYRNNGSLKSWIYRITVNRSLDFLRRQKRRNIFQRIESVFQISENGREKYFEEVAVTEIQVEMDEQSVMIENAINTLPVNQKTAFILSKYEELSYKEITEIMGISHSSVESLIFRAKKNLQEKLVNYFSENAR
jgi:RNA polymerase sigma factor (sigma-70 family)